MAFKLVIAFFKVNMALFERLCYLLFQLSHFVYVSGLIIKWSCEAAPTFVFVVTHRAQQGDQRNSKL